MRPRTILFASILSALATSTAAYAQTQCSSYAWNNPSARYPAGVTHHTFRSASMAVDVGFNVYTPPGYATSTQRYPVIYYLHGKGGNEGTMVANVVTWMRQRTSEGKIRPAILVFANGAIDSGYADAKDQSRLIETSILRELVPHLDANWRTNACKGQRAISGFSMGGAGALLYAFKRPEMFSSVVAYAPALVDYEELSAPVAQCMFGNDATYYSRYQPLTWLTANQSAVRAGVSTRITVGTLDPLRDADVEMGQLLSELGVDNELETVPGCDHNHGCLWTTAGDRGVAVHEAAFTPCTASASEDPAPAPSDEDAGAGDSEEALQAGTNGGCSSAPGAGLGGLALLALAVLLTRRRRAATVAVALLAAACTDGLTAGEPPQGSPDADVALDGDVDGAAAGSVRCQAFLVAGSASSSTGATWTYQSTDDGVAYSLRGILLLPPGAGPFPAVVVSHGKGGAATSYSRTIGLTMRQWGLAVIATNYSHGASSAGDLPLGAEGASPENVARAHKAFDLLRCVPSVNTARVAAHGHSMGAFVTTALLGAHSADFVVGSHTAGGINTSGASDAAAPSRAAVQGLRAPYQLHHGTADTVVPLAMDEALRDELVALGTTNQLVSYPGVTHPAMATSATMLTAVRAWYTTHGLWR